MASEQREAKTEAAQSSRAHRNIVCRCRPTDLRCRDARSLVRSIQQRVGCRNVALTFKPITRYIIRGASAKVSLNICREFVQLPCILAEQTDVRAGFCEQRSDVRTEATTQSTL